MCTCDDGSGATFSAPRPAPGEAVDPITLEPVDEVRVTTLVENLFDGLLTGDDRITRAGLGLAPAWAPAGQFEDGRALLGLRAEHGYSALISVRRGDHTSHLLFDTGLTPDAMTDNAERLGVDLGSVQAVVLSHGHFDHAGGLLGMAQRRGMSRMPLTVHPEVWTRRRLRTPDGELAFPTLSRRALEGEGFEVIERRQPSLRLDGSVLVTGEVDRATEYERGMPPAHEAWDGQEWRHDPLVRDDQALVVNLRDRGLVIVTGCGHAGVVNIVRHAMRLTGVDRLHALFGGFHLGGPYFEPIIPATVSALSELDPSLIVPGHCTGWRAQHALAAALPDAWACGSAGSQYRLAPTA